LTAITPLFGVAVPILAHRLADPGKGSGLVMVCTFGDTTDVTWWRDLQLETRPVLGADGRMLPAPPPGLTTEAGIKAYGELAGTTAKAARRRVTDLLDAAGLLRGEPEPIRHSVKFYEKGEVPLEIITTRQWYIRNGSRDPALADKLLARGRELSWHPEHMRTRYEHWVTGLTGDWLLSRQRFYGVPIPVWYPIDPAGRLQADQPILPDEASLPVDPAADPPPGYRPDQRGQPGGFAGDADVMDTWATSSLTPLFATGWPHDRDLMSRLFPLDLRPQAHEIIRTWLFYAVLRTQLEEDALPWRHAAISGWILDPDRKKMGKSAGNAATPADLLREHGSDAIRYWAASARLGVDTAIDVGQMKIGRRLAIKVLNAARFVLSVSTEGPDDHSPASPSPSPSDASAARMGADLVSPGQHQSGSHDGEITAPIDLALVRRLAAVTQACTTALDSYEHASALEQAERFFWFFCDDYLELVKARAYGEHGPEAAVSARATLRLGLSVVLRLLAPVLPFVTEEVWSWWQDGSIHLAAWPDAAALRGEAGPGDDRVLTAAAAAIGAIRRAKSQANVPMKNPVRALVVAGGGECLKALDAAGQDVRSAGHVGSIELREALGAEPTYEVAM
jgi:valyl-tRNA synthetase